MPGFLSYNIGVLMLAFNEIIWKEAIEEEVHGGGYDGVYCRLCTFFKFGIGSVM